MNRRERYGGVVWLLLGAAICVGALNMRMGDLHRPGPGLMPFLAGALLALFGLVLFLSTSARGGDTAPPPSETEGRGKNWKPGVSCLVALFGYAFLLKPLGFYTATGFFLFALFKLGHRRKTLMPLVVAGVTVVLSYIVFSVMLKIRFPGGITGF